MSSFYQWDSLHPSTRRGIELQPWDLDYSSDPLVLRSCGCEHMRGGRWSLCRYHEGVEDGAQNVDGVAQAEVERLTATVETQHTTITLLQSIADKAEAREQELRAITGQGR